jgi:hypothetical protein
MAPDPAAEIRDGLRQMVAASPAGRISDAVASVGDKATELAGKAKRVVEDTAQGTRRLIASKMGAATPRGDIALPASRTPTATPQGTMRGTAPKMNDRPLNKQLRKITVSPTDNGGYIVSHHYKPNNGRGTPTPEKHAFTSYDDVHAHLEKLGPPEEES